MSDSCFINLDVSDNQADFIKTRIPTARIQHKCGECGGEIKAGEQYESVSGSWDSDFRTFKTCLPCVEIREELFCSYFYEEMYESLENEDFKVDMATLERFSPAAQRKLIENLVLPWMDDDE